MKWLISDLFRRKRLLESCEKANSTPAMLRNVEHCGARLGTITLDLRACAVSYAYKIRVFIYSTKGFCISVQSLVVSIKHLVVILSLLVVMMWTTVAVLTTLLPQFLLSEKCRYVVNSSMPLQEAFSPFQECTNDIRIELLSGNHFITSQTFFPAKLKAIELVAVGNDVTVTCDYELRSMLNYTLYFDGLYSVVFSGINFYYCPRPLRMDTLSNVTIQNCSFR